jgi:large subunit ribosomal protein L31
LLKLVSKVNRLICRSSGGGKKIENTNMKSEIHPNYGEMTATCSCGNTIKTASTRSKDIHLDVCSSCHPFYTGKQKKADSGGRVDRFNKRFAGRTSNKA